MAGIEAFLRDIDSLPKIVKNLHTVEREYFDAPPTAIDLPEWG